MSLRYLCREAWKRGEIKCMLGVLCDIPPQKKREGKKGGGCFTFEK